MIISDNESNQIEINSLNFECVSRKISNLNFLLEAFLSNQDLGMVLFDKNFAFTRFFYVMASGGLCFFIYINNSQSQ